MAVRAIIIVVLLGALCIGSMATSDKSGNRPVRKTEDIGIRDPFILPVAEEKAYYMYGTTRAMPDGGGGPCFETFVSKDLKQWEGPIRVFGSSPDFWGTQTYWAPEVHRYRGKYYLFGTFSAPGVLRATHILVSDSPRGLFKPLADKPVTPSDWQCLDGTLFVDDAGKPWIVFCHEWEQIHDGAICALRLTDDLKHPDGKPIVLFHASEAPWAIAISGEGDNKNYVTDGPFLYRAKDGSLLMLWSSFSKSGYAQGIARSKSGKTTGPWVQEPEPLFDQDGGHGMVFRTFDGKLMFVLHAPNGGPTRPRFIPIREKAGRLMVEQETE